MVFQREDNIIICRKVLSAKDSGKWVTQLLNGLL